MTTLDVYSDYVCPWCYYCTLRVEKLRAAWDISVAYRHFPLHPETPAAGQTLEQLFAGRNLDIPAAQARMTALMAQEGLPYGQRTMTYNSRLAQELAAWADTVIGGDSIHSALFQAYFVHNQNLASIDNLVRVAKQVGLSPSTAQAVLEQRQFRQVVDDDWQRSRELGITSVPTFVLGSRRLAGAQTYEQLDGLVSSAGAERRTH